jgi:CRP/FNR family transcriptional regulator
MNRRQPRCTVCGPHAGGVFCVLAGAHLERLDQTKTVQHYEKGQVLFYEGHNPFGIHCIYSGRIKLYKHGPRGETQVIRLLGKGEVMGFRALVAREPYAASAEAIEPATSCFISRETLFDIIRESPALAMELMTKLAKELRISEEQAVKLSHESVPRRLAGLLMWLLEAESPANRRNKRIALPLQRTEMAQMIATTPETLSRVLHDFERDGYIELTRSSIVLKDAPKIEKLTNK